jgi:hypothetical protein
MKTYNFRAQVRINGNIEYRDFVITATSWRDARQQLREAMNTAV